MINMIFTQGFLTNIYFVTLLFKTVVLLLNNLVLMFICTFYFGIICLLSAM